MHELNISAHVISNIGLKRIHNEDNYLINQSMNKTSQYVSEEELKTEKRMESWNWAAVFDGMGGGGHGEEASRIAAEEFMSHLLKTNIATTEEDIERIARQSFLEANCRIVKERQKKTILGTTATVLCFRQNRAKLFHLGDSRAYLLREGRLYQLTKDQTLANMKIEAGFYEAMSPEAERDRNLLTEYIGADETMTSLRPLESTWITLKTADKLLMCSDGLYHLCPDEEIREILLSGNVPSELADKLVYRALKKGGTDNITCLVLKVGERKMQSGGESNVH